MIQMATGARPVTRKENPRVYNIVENLCIAGGMDMPKINVIDDPQLNAFASGINKNTYTVTVTTGICNRLNDEELAGVIAHELTHIRNNDTKVLIISIVFVGIISTVLNVLTNVVFRMFLYGGGGSRNKKNGGGYKKEAASMKEGVPLKEGWYAGNNVVLEWKTTSTNSGGSNYQAKHMHGDINNQNFEKYEDKSKTSYDTHIHQAKGYNPHQIVRDQLPPNLFVDSDVKKANDLAPTLMTVRILKEMGEDSKYVSFVCGVKAVIHPVNSDDMIDHITSALRERGKLFRFLQWTTGEISFFKDLVFNIDQAKKDIKEIRSGKASTWWRALKNIKASRRFHKWTRTGPVLPNATIVISMDEVEYIKSNHGFDLMEEELGEKILKAYNLIQFIMC
jgi:hypothetical protein